MAALTSEPVSLAVKADAPWKDIREFLAHAKANPGQVRIGNSGRGSFTHLLAVALENRAGLKLVHVPFGRELAVTTVLGDKIEASVQLPAEIMTPGDGPPGPRARDHRRQAAGEPARRARPSRRVASTSRWRSGVGIAVPRGTPEAVIARLERAFTQAAQSAEFREFAARMGAGGRDPRRAGLRRVHGG